LYSAVCAVTHEHAITTITYVVHIVLPTAIFGPLVAVRASQDYWGMPNLSLIIPNECLLDAHLASHYITQSTFV